MELPELYRYGREGYWFNFKKFSIFMIDAVVQVRFCFRDSIMVL